MPKILLVEDNETITKGLKYSLEQENFEVETALNKGEVYQDGNKIFFTSLEYKILYLLLSNKNILVTREQILDRIWDVAGNFVNDNTLTVYIKRIRNKLDDKEGKIIQTVRGIGYKVVE